RAKCSGRAANLLPVDASGILGRDVPRRGNRILRRHGSAPGYSSGFTIMDREGQKDLINAVAARLTNYFHKEDRNTKDICRASCLGRNRAWPRKRTQQKTSGNRSCQRSVAVKALGEETVVESAAVIIDLGYECLSAWTVTPKCNAHRKCRAIESVTNFLACVTAPSSGKPLARAAVIAAEYVQPVP